MIARALDVLFRLGLGVLFVYSAWYKLQDPALFADAVKGYRLLPDILSGYVAIVLPPAELIAGLALIVSKWAREAALLILAMLLVFLFGLTQAWIRGLEISCGCFGPDDGEPAPLWLDIVRDILLFVPTVWIVVRPNVWLFWRRVGKVSVLVLAVLGGSEAVAEPVAPQPGVWTTDFTVVRQAAERTGRPLLTVVSAPGCTFCKRAQKALMQPTALDWARSNGVYLVSAQLAETNSSPAQAAAVTFVAETPFEGVRSYPAAAICVFGEKGIRTGFTLRRGKMPGGSDPKLEREIILALEKSLRGLGPFL